MIFTLTDMSIACALGCGQDEVLRNATTGSQAGMHPYSDLIPGRTVIFGGIDTPLPRIDDEKKNIRCNQLLMLAVEQMRDTLNTCIARYGHDRIGIVLGASNTGIHEAMTHILTWMDTGTCPDAFSFRSIELGAPSEFLSQLLGLTGPNYTISTACSSSAKAFASARHLINHGVCDAVIVGGVDGICRFAMNGFSALGAIAQGKTNPMSANRDGINLGEAVTLFTLERDQPGIHLLGIGESSDAYHLTSPDPTGSGAAAAMRAALKDAGVAASDVDYVNMHGTGTHHNDAMESKAIWKIFGDRPLCASTKPMTGHTLGAAGALEAGLGWLMLSPRNTCHACFPHCFDGVRDPALPPIRLAPRNVCHATRIYLSNSFAFGGSNASILLGADETR